MKPLLLIITILFSLPAISQRIYGVEDTSYRRRAEVNLSRDAVKVFPNPAINDVYITIKMEDLRIKNVFLYDKEGNRVIEQKITSTLSAPIKFSVASLNPGIYYLVLETNKQPYRVQLLKQ